MTDLRVLVVAKAPVPGRVKTRLGATIGATAAAEVAAASLLDTLLAGTAAAGAGRCHLALEGDLAEAVRGRELLAAAAGWTTSPQRGSGLAERLVHAHAAVPPGPGPVVQVGMDTPQVTAIDLVEVAGALGDADAVLGPADDGGWWVLALRDPAAARPLLGVPMSTPTTHDDTLAALTAAGLRVAKAPALRDVDTAEDAEAVAALAPDGHFARAWRAHRVVAGGTA
ncbi:TIGR04282 family arsenosugar biosynthesis glycosyltransferase [Nocardioides taihuensis]|uniref:DUF2064 domain-containing protein n=1 Tax=Nocardioides taihuensis TaxID=1835606 RepID=A0ABW0BIP7_9ACTN